MEQLVACPKCSVHGRVSDQACPACGARYPSPSGGARLAFTAGALLMGLSVGGCDGGDDGNDDTNATASDSAQPAYGVPATESGIDPSAGSDTGNPGSTTADTTGAAESSTGGTSEGSTGGGGSGGGSSSGGGSTSG